MTEVLFLLRFAAVPFVLRTIIDLSSSTNSGTRCCGVAKNVRFCIRPAISRTFRSPVLSVWLRPSGAASRIRQGDDVRLATADDWLSRWLYWRACGAKVFGCTSPYTDSLFIRMYKKGDYERCLFAVIDRYCGLLDFRAYTN